MVIHLFTVATDTEPGKWLFAEARVNRQNSAGNPYATQYLQMPLICELVTKSLEVSGWFLVLAVTLTLFSGWELSGKVLRVAGLTAGVIPEGGDRAF